MKLLSAVVLTLVVFPLICSGIGYAQAKECPKHKDINACSSMDLTSIKNIGPKTAEKIIAGRPYSSVRDLTRVKGIGPKTMQSFLDADFCVGKAKK